MAPNVKVNIKLNVAAPSVPAPSTAATGPKATTTQSAEAQAVPQVTLEPGRLDTFAVVQPVATAVLTGTQVLPLANRLASSLEGVVDGLVLPDQLNYDLSVQLPALMGSAVLDRDVKATRLMQFIVPYAERLATLAQSQPLTADQRRAVADQLVESMLKAGLRHVLETATGRSGLQVAQAMLAVETPDEARKVLNELSFTSTDPTALVAGTTQPELTPSPQQVPVAVTVAAALQSQQGDDPRDSSEERPPARDGGPRWGLLHRSRSAKGRIDDDDKWVPDDKALYAAGIVALVISIAVAAMLTLLR